MIIQHTILIIAPYRNAPFYQQSAEYSVVTTTDALLFRSWHNCAAKRMKEAQNQIPVTNFSKINLYLQMYIMSNIILFVRVFI
jgi:hypothetical protein